MSIPKFRTAIPPRMAILLALAVILTIGAGAYAAGWRARLADPAYQQLEAAVCQGGGGDGTCDGEEKCPPGSTKPECCQPPDCCPTN